MTTAIVLAGGFGTRLRSVVPDLPKPMAPVNGRPFLEHQFDYWIGQSISRFIVSVGYRHEVISGHFGERYCGIPISYAVEHAPLGTGGGLLLAASFLKDDEPFLIVNGDTIFEVPITTMLQFHRQVHSAWTFALFRADQADRFMAMDVADNGRVISFGTRRADRGSLANGGIYLTDRRVLAAAKQSQSSKLSLEDELLPMLAASGAAFFGFACNGRFLDIGVPEDYRHAANILVH